jgi:hypothetical protein
VEELGCYSVSFCGTDNMRNLSHELAGCEFGCIRAGTDSALKDRRALLRDDGVWRLVGAGAGAGAIIWESIFEEIL